MSVLNPTYQELLDKVDELELVITANDKRMQELEKENEWLRNELSKYIPRRIFDRDDTSPHEL